MQSVDLLFRIEFQGEHWGAILILNGQTQGSRQFLHPPIYPFMGSGSGENKLPKKFKRKGGLPLDCFELDSEKGS